MLVNPIIAWVNYGWIKNKQPEYVRAVYFELISLSQSASAGGRPPHRVPVCDGT